MLKIEVKYRGEDAKDVYINDSLYPYIYSEIGLFFLECKRISDFLFLSSFKFEDFVRNEVNNIKYIPIAEKNINCFFSYCINTTYVDKGYLEYISQNEEYFGKSNSYVEKGNYISISLRFNFSEWKKLYSVKEFQLYVFNQVKKNKRLTENASIYFSDLSPYDDTKVLEIEFRNLNQDTTISNYLELYMPILNNILNRSISELDTEYTLDIYTTYFQFPDEYKVSCKQYLIYFSQFLLDLGINVSTEIKDTTVGTFFSIMPTGKKEALHDIKELLEEYLNAPNIINESTSILNNDLAVVQFQATLFHLKSQLAFANSQIEMKQAIIQSKDATIQSLNLVNYQLSDKIQNLVPKEEESIIKGLISVTKVEKAGFKLNLPEIIRRLKRKL